MCITVAKLFRQLHYDIVHQISAESTDSHTDTLRAIKRSTSMKGPEMPRGDCLRAGKESGRNGSGRRENITVDGPVMGA